MTISLETIVAIVSVVSGIIASVVALFAIWLSLASNRHAQQSAIRESTDIIFKEWWSDELRELRRYFFLEFIPKHRAKLIGKSMKEISQVVPEDNGRTTRLCYFFDRVGWLGAAGLIEVDYVLGPMQHMVRRTWIVMEPLIMEGRELRPSKDFDPVFQYGFEWLFKRSCQPKKHQAFLLGYRFHAPRIRTDTEISNLKAMIDADENDFQRRLNSVLEQTQTKGNAK